MRDELVETVVTALMRHSGQDVHEVAGAVLDAIGDAGFDVFRFEPGFWTERPGHNRGDEPPLPT